MLQSRLAHLILAASCGCLLSAVIIYTLVIKGHIIEASSTMHAGAVDTIRGTHTTNAPEVHVPFHSVYWRPGRKMGLVESLTVLHRLMATKQSQPHSGNNVTDQLLIGQWQINHPDDFVSLYKKFKDEGGPRLGALVQVRDPRAAIASAYDYHVVNCQEMFMRKFVYLKNPAGLVHSCLAECCAPHAFEKMHEVLARNATPPGYRICDFIRDELSFDDAAKAMSVLEYTKTQGSFDNLKYMVQSLDKDDAYVTRYELMNDAAEIPGEVARICSFFGLPKQLCRRWTQLLLRNVAMVRSKANSSTLHNHITSGSTKSDRWTSFFARLSNVTDFLFFMEKSDKANTNAFFNFDIWS